MVPCGFPMALCSFPMVLCHGATIRRSPVQLCGLPYGAVPRRCHQALTSAALRASRWCSFHSGFFAAASAHSRQRSSASSVPQSQRCSSLFRAAVSGAAAVSSVPRSPALQQICYWQSAQKPRFCAREDGKVASGSVNVAFLQITAHVSKTQMPHNQIINF